MVPWLAAGMREGAALASARNKVSTMRCDVSTFPPATAAGGLAFTTVPAGAITRMGRIRPEVAGYIFGEETTKNVVDGGDGDGFDSVHISGALRCGAREIHFRAVAIYFYAHFDFERDGTDPVIVKKIFRCVFAGLQCAKRGAHHFLGIFQQEIAVGVQFPFAVFLGNFKQAAVAGSACGDLRSQDRLRALRECARSRE